MRPNVCPSKLQLTEYLLGTLDEDHASRVIEHVDSCDNCEATLENLENVSDTMISKLRHPVSEDRYVREPAFQRLLAVLESHDFSSLSDPFANGGVANPPVRNVTQLDEYELLEKLGEGGMGSVYRARHTKLGRVVALKVMSQQRMSHADAVSRFEREMLAVGKLNHPNIVHAYDAGEDHKTHYLVMEFVRGIDLRRLVKQKGPLPVPEACELIRQAAVGLEHAHRHGMVHRDIKPSNLMVTVRGRVKILDLGLALLQAHQRDDDRELTTEGQLMGTIEYMAPEQGDDSHVVDQRADIYSLGATFYSLLSGNAPFSGKQFRTLVKKVRALIDEPIPPISERRPGLPEGLDKIVHKMLAKSPSERCVSARQVAQDLAPFAAGSNIAALLQGIDLENPNSAETGLLPVPAVIGESETRQPATSATRMARPVTAAQPKPTGTLLPLVAPLVVLVTFVVVGTLAFAIAREKFLTLSEPTPALTPDYVAVNHKMTEDDAAVWVGDTGDWTDERDQDQDVDPIGGEWHARARSFLGADAGRHASIRWASGSNRPTSIWVAQAPREREISRVYFSQDNDFLVTTTADLEMVAWSLSQDKPIPITRSSSKTRSVYLSPHGRFVPESVELSGLELLGFTADVNVESESELSQPNLQVSAIDFSPQGILALGCEDGSVCVMVPGFEPYVLPSMGVGIRQVRFSADGGTLAVTYVNNSGHTQADTLRLWNLNSTDTPMIFQPESVAIDDFVLSSNGWLFAAPTHGKNSIRIWNKHGKEVKPIHAGQRVSTIEFLPAPGNQLVYGLASGTISIDEAMSRPNSGRPSLEGGTAEISDLVVSLSGNRLISRDNRDQVYVWDKIAQQGLVSGVSTKTITAMALSNDGSVLAIAARSGDRGSSIQNVGGTVQIELWQFTADE